MIACIDKSLLKVRVSVQKDVDVEEVLSKLQFFNTREEAYESGCVPLCFCTSVRTAYTNMVVEHETDRKRYYVSLNLNQALPHKGYDLVAYLSSLAVAKLIDCTLPENHKLMFNSQFTPIGVYNPDPGICDPIIYSHVIIKDDNLEALKSALLEGNQLVSIKDMNRKGNLLALLNEVLIVKEEK